MRRIEIGFGVGYDKNGHTLMWGESPLPRLQYALDTIVCKASNKFGGAALIHVRGAWKDPSGVNVLENGYILRIDGLDASQLDDAKAFAAFVRSELHQQSIVFSVQTVNIEFF